MRLPYEMLVRRMRAFMFAGICIVAADQLHEFLRMHLMAVRAAGILLRHWARSAAVGDLMFLVRKFGRHPAHVGSNHGQLLLAD